MVPIFFVWSGSNDPEDLRPLGLGVLGKHSKAQQLTNCVVGVVYAESMQARIVADALHPSLQTLPGANGKLKDKHLKHLAKEFPGSKSGDAFRSVLDAIYARLSDEHFNADNY